ncbi:T9SS type A sorting domain-containing protein [Labilibacter marinus]|uniref:T9SS type A sorting domain-containing protein n=1 Tax=Labilibacter marinus TaxID=1477105 RepID=UPI00094FCFB9|nr:T9SS type A sorting domain-containing protein [Labilibacter marinus]
MLKKILKCTGAMVLAIIPFTSYAQQQITVDVSPTISKSIKGHKELDRVKYFNLAASSTELKKDVIDYDQTMSDYYIDELKMNVGRRLSMVKSETNWTNALKEDASREGYTDIDYYISQKNPNDDGLDILKAAYGDNQDLACHEGSDPYPDYMDLYTVDGTKGHKFPSNAESAAELISAVLKYNFTDFQRPAFYELMNEPHWKHMDDQRFIDLHVKTKQKVTADGLSVKVGGPCSSVSNYHKNEYQNLNSITKFMTRTNYELDFYSFHSYDYMRWDAAENDFVGAINSGLPLEGVLDACATYAYNRHGKDFKYVTSEHGGYISDTNNREEALEYLGQKYFPGSGFDYEMQKRNIDNFIMVNSAIANTMTYMNHPHVVLKSVPFILLQSANWDTKYYSSLLVKEDFDKTSDVWVESKLIDYYKFFKDVQGRRIDSYCDDTDIQFHSFVDGKKLVMVFHNQSDVDGEITVNVNDLDTAVEDVMIRRLKRQVDFRPELTEETVASLSTINIGSQESIVVFVNYETDIVESETVPENIYYSTESAVQFTGSKDITLRVQDYRYVADAELRVGISRKAAYSKEVKIFFNGTELTVPVEDCADRITGDFYATTKVVKVPRNLVKISNTVRVTFPDGKSGGVGAAVLRARMGDDVSVKDGLVVRKGELKIFPNPTNSDFTVASDALGMIDIIGMDGKIVKSIESFGGNTKVTKSGLNEGTYIVQLVTDKEVFTNKLLIK